MEDKDAAISVTSVITVVLRGQAYDLTRAEAESLRNQLTVNLGDGAVQSALRYTYPYPSITTPMYPTIATNSTGAPVPPETTVVADKT